ncbi:hypothetical protein Y1Q_0016195 [Alligator mississippiensis]|uniref:DDE Tnp4 domain-containing protein n=1 Tax=Alligator mississippiensis TaxID=8496 RepID=A0A151P1B2_ALLMI|nr:hypothetical protein Y1Q_0016195 [Alligator mississippiensis]
MWLPLPADTSLAITLMKLATSASLQYIGHLFGVGKATTGEAMLECIRASDRTHSPITFPYHGDCLYYSWRGFNSMEFQAVVDYKGAFMYVSACWVGSIHDACIFQKSSLPGLMECGKFMLGMLDLQLDAVAILPLLFRDPAYHPSHVAIHWPPEPPPGPL